MAALQMWHPPALVARSIGARRRALEASRCSSAGAKRHATSSPMPRRLTALFEKYEAAVILPRVENKTRLGKKTDELAEARRRAEL